MRSPRLAPLICLLLPLLFGTARSAAAGDESLDLSLSLYREEVIVSTQFPGGQSHTNRTRSWIKGEKMRTEAAEGRDVTIIRGDLNLVYVINLERHVYTETSLTVFRQAARGSLLMLGRDPAYQWTNRKKNIGKWSCREVVVADENFSGGDRLRVIWWMSEAPELEKKWQRHIMRLTAGAPTEEAVRQSFEKLLGITGFPVRTETTATRQGAMLQSVQTLEKIERRDMDDALFELPAGLTKILVPVPDSLSAE